MYDTEIENSAKFNGNGGCTLGVSEVLLNGLKSTSTITAEVFLYCEIELTVDIITAVGQDRYSK